MKHVAAKCSGLALVALLLTLSFPALAEERLHDDVVLEYPSVARNQQRLAGASQTSVIGRGVSSNEIHDLDPVTWCAPTETSCFNANLCTQNSHGVMQPDKKCETDGDGLMECWARVNKRCDRYVTGSGLIKCQTCN